MKIKIGGTYQCKITGFKGVCVGYVQYLTGCSQALILPKGTKNSRPDSHWIDEQYLEQNGEKVFTLESGTNPGFGKAPPTI